MCYGNQHGAFKAFLLTGGSSVADAEMLVKHMAFSNNVPQQKRSMYSCLRAFSHICKVQKWTKLTSQKLNNIIQHQNHLLISSTHLKPRTKLKKLLHFNIPIDDIP